MLGGRGARGVGIASALSVGALLLYFGLGLVSRRAEAGRGTSAPPVQTPVGNDEGHERKLLEAALQRNPRHTPVLFRLAQISESAGDHAKAAEHLRAILRHEPANQEAQLEMGKVLYQSGDVAGALEHTQAVLKINPDHPDALYNLGAIYGNLGDSRLAREHWNHLLAVSPESESASRARSLLGQLPAESPQRGAETSGRTAKDIRRQ